MSFSNGVREEICAYISDKDKRFACLYGMLLFGRTLSREQICFQTESSIAAEQFGKLFNAVFRQEINCREHIRKSGAVLYIYEINDTALTDMVYSKYRFSETERLIDSEIIATNSLGVFTAGVFLACGSVNDPSKEYHMEFTVPEEGLASQLITLLGDIGVTAKSVIRRGQPVVYIKGSESIEDTLTFIGAQQSTLEIMNVKIFKDVRNRANRRANCDTANIDKVVNAAVRQINDIQLIADTDGLDSLSDELKELAELRLENVDMSLQEIGENLSEPISRSGVNHRFRKIAQIAESIRNRGASGENK